MKNGPQIPPMMINISSPVKSSKFIYDFDKPLASFTPKKYKNVILISSMHHSGEIDDKTKVPEIINFRNMTKGGVDV